MAGTRAGEAPRSDQAPSSAHPASAHQADAARRRRLRWRARRGLLENDLLLERFLEKYESALSDDEVVGLDQLLDLPDNELLDLILGRVEPGKDASPQARQILAMLREV